MLIFVALRILGTMHNESFAQIITTLRNSTGLTQQDVATHLGIARSTYASLEAARRDPNLAEIRGLSQLYQLPTNKLIDRSMPVADIIEEPHAHYAPAPTLPEPPYFPEKLTQILLYIGAKLGARAHVGEAVIFKLLYFIDFGYQQRYGAPITGLAYVHTLSGPEPQLAMFRKLTASMQQEGQLEIVETLRFRLTQKKYLPSQKANLSCLSGQELDYVDQVIRELGDKTGEELSRLSMATRPWQQTTPGKPISYGREGNQNPEPTKDKKASQPARVRAR